MRPARGRETRSIPELTVVVICGNNERLYQSLKRECRDDENFRVLRKTDRMADYMKAADVFITKPGGLSSTEAAVSGTPIVHYSPIPGCESKNFRFFTENGMSLGARTPLSLFRVLRDDQTGERLAAMSRRQAEGIRPTAAQDICLLAEEAAQKAAQKAQTAETAPSPLTNGEK